MKLQRLIRPLLAAALALCAAAPIIAQTTADFDRPYGYLPRQGANIVTQNLAATGDATAGSALQILTNGASSLGLSVKGTYTGALSLQGTIDGINWTTVGGTPFLNRGTNASSATITSGTTGSFLANVNGWYKVRIVALGAVTGAATVDAFGTIADGASSGGGGGGGGASTVADGANVVEGTTTDTAVGDANGTINAHARQVAKYAPLIQSDTSRLTSSAGSKAPAAALATTAIQMGGTYNASGVTLADTQEAGIQLDNKGRQYVVQPDNVTITTSTCSAINCTLFTGVNTAGYDSFYFQNTTASGSYTINLQGSVDGITYTDLKCQDTTATGSNGTALTSTSTGAAQIQCRASPLIQAKVLAYTSGTITASAMLSKKSFQPLVGIYNAASLSVNAGQAAHDAAVSGNPVRVGCRGRTSQYATTIVNDDTVDVQCDLNGATITKAYSVSGSDWTATVNLTDTTSTALKASGGASIKNYVTWCTFSGISTTVATQIKILDNATLKYPFNMKAGGGDFHVVFPTPIQGTAATAMNVQLSGSPTGAIDVTCGGYQGQ